MWIVFFNFQVPYCEAQSEGVVGFKCPQVGRILFFSLLVHFDLLLSILLGLVLIFWFLLVWLGGMSKLKQLNASHYQCITLSMHHIINASHYLCITGPWASPKCCCQALPPLPQVIFPTKKIVKVTFPPPQSELLKCSFKRIAWDLQTDWIFFLMNVLKNLRVWRGCMQTNILLTSIWEQSSPSSYIEGSMHKDMRRARSTEIKNILNQFLHPIMTQPPC